LVVDSPPKLKELRWMAHCHRDLKEFPEEVQRAVGYALYVAQAGDKHPDAKVLKYFGGAGVLEVVENYGGSTYRAVYTVKFEEAVYVLHVFQKKSKHGVATPKAEMDLIKQRLAQATRDYAARKLQKGRTP
jgi:phage-related protein